MSKKHWQDFLLTEVIETQNVLFAHLVGALDGLGVLPRARFAQGLREMSTRIPLREGVRGCVCAYADMLETPLPGIDAPAWSPTVVDGGRPDGAAEGTSGANGATDGLANGPQSGATQGPTEDPVDRSDDDEDAGGLPAWRPRLVDGDEPESA